jgi:DNA-binding CsgD family transcriptional regulator
MQNLSETQMRIGRLVALGYCNRDIASELSTTEQAVKSSLHSMFDKLGVWNRVELANRFARLMSKPIEVPEGLAEILITEELSRRTPYEVDQRAVERSLQYLSTFVSAVDAPGMIQGLTNVARHLCNAGTSGLSVLDTTPSGAEVFHWDVLSGELAAAAGNTTPRDFSPCGTTLAFGAPQLFLQPDRYYPYCRTANPRIEEGLVIPMTLPNGPDYGTLWIASHDAQRKFTTAEVDIMTSLCSFTMAAGHILGLRPRVTVQAMAS